ncbi:hypothetical protein H6F67_12395 [Microcoleus sp. FACHB-1515]|uniref:hypothetical protein n=1 Tax=Cyanophyceae TaxID=3028117 RepID=UPI001683B53A|nr:hypothetical protein [Microcoleus sp. FACHB-1515]MBD2090654.1 hypothetical protein [Microcoleus sp. FACHB-1515]
MVNQSIAVHSLFIRSREIANTSRAYEVPSCSKYCGFIPRLILNDSIQPQYYPKGIDPPQCDTNFV